MDRCSYSDNPHIAAVRIALAAIDMAFDDTERRVAEVALYTAGVALSEVCWNRHQWLVAADQWLTEHHGCPDYKAREDRWIAKLHEYNALMAALGDATAIVKFAKPVDPEEAAMAQGEMF